MGFLLHIPVVISFMLLAAHFMRGDQTVVVAITLLLPCILFLGKSWAARIVQIVLVIGAVEWIRTLVELQAFRVEHGLPWLRLAIIIGTVALFTGCSALVFFHKSLRRKYRLGSDYNKTDI